MSLLYHPDPRYSVERALREAVRYRHREPLNMRLHLSNEFLRTAAEKLYGHRPADGKLHLFGVRSASPAGETAIETHPPVRNRYDDAMGVFGTALRVFTATVDPGATWSAHPENPKGAAHLISGRWLYRFGTHKGRPALVQAAPVTVRRDRDRDNRPEDGEPLDTGWFGINIHRGGVRPAVNDWSAGCQVIPWQYFSDFYALCTTSAQTGFEYYLFAASDLERLATG